MKFVTHRTTLHLSFKIKCCVDRLRPPMQSGRDMLNLRSSGCDPNEIAAGPLFFRRLAGATSRRSVCFHPRGEPKRGTVAYVCRGPQPDTVGFHDRTAD